MSLAKLKLEDKYILDANLPDQLANQLFWVSDAVEHVFCLIWGHAWDGWMNKPGVWCVYCGKQERREAK